MQRHQLDRRAGEKGSGVLEAGQIAAEFRQLRARTQAIFALVSPEAYYERPIALRHPIAFYDGHLDAFIWNKLFREALGEPAFNPDFDAVFARGIDPSTEAEARRKGRDGWPGYSEIQAYKAHVRGRLFAFLRTADMSALPDGLFGLLLEHEAMHQETLLYMLHQLPAALKVRPERLPPPDLGPAPKAVMRQVPAGQAVLGAKKGEFSFGWDNEFPQTEVRVPSFSIDAYDVTNGQYLEFVASGGYHRREFWDDETWAWRSEQGVEHPFYWFQEDGEWFYRDFFADRPLPHSWPVTVTHAEARAYARFVGKDLPTEAEWHRSAFGDHRDWPYPWGTEPPTAEHGNFDFTLWSPTRVGSYPKGTSTFGVHDLVGNGWEWTSSVFAPFPGFRPSESYPPYSVDFFDGQHYVMKGASWFTAARMVRRSFRNWFFWHYPYMYATFRCVGR